MSKFILFLQNKACNKSLALLVYTYMTNKMKQFIQDNGLVRIQASPMSEAFDLWECVGGHVWTFDMIKEAVK